MPDLHLSPADVKFLKALSVTADTLPEADRVFLEEMRDRQREYEAAPDTLEAYHAWRVSVELQMQFERVTASEQVRALEAELRKVTAEKELLRKRHRNLTIAMVLLVVTLVPLAVAGWGRG